MPDVASPLTSPVAETRPGAKNGRLTRAFRASGQPAFAWYASGSVAPGAGQPAADKQGMVVLSLAGSRICGVTQFLDAATLPASACP